MDKKATIFFLLAGLLSVIIIINRNAILYGFDSMRSTFYDISSIAQSQLDDNQIKKKTLYKKTYSSLPSYLFQSGPFLYVKVAKNTSIRKAAESIIQYTEHYRLYNVIKNLKKFNNIKGHRAPRKMTLIYPGIISSFTIDPLSQKPEKVPYTSGIYLTGTNAGSSKFYSSIKNLKSKGINAVVFDIKDITGIINFKSSLPEVKKYKTSKNRTIHNLPLLIKKLKKHGIYSIARIAVFRDHRMVRRNSYFAIHSKRTGDIWNKYSKELWCDPTNKKVQDYNIKLAIEVANMGVNEIQFDYIRFPTVGNLRDAKFRYDFGPMKKEKAIAHFLKRSYREMKKRKTFLSIDIFGVVAWNKKVDIIKTGQRIQLLAKYCDVISPMLYPSHFSDDFDNNADPRVDSYYYIFTGSKKVRKLGGKKIIIRPWLQAFKWRVNNYNTKYISDQMKGSDDGSGHGYLFWNARNDYDMVYKALSNP